MEPLGEVVEEIKLVEREIDSYWKKKRSCGSKNQEQNG